MPRNCFLLRLSFGLISLLFFHLGTYIFPCLSWNSDNLTSLPFFFFFSQKIRAFSFPSDSYSVFFSFRSIFWFEDWMHFYIFHFRKSLPLCSWEETKVGLMLHMLYSCSGAKGLLVHPWLFPPEPQPWAMSERWWQPAFISSDMWRW